MTGAELENHLERYLELRRALGFEIRAEGVRLLCKAGDLIAE
jgi:hypothetical protein